MSVHVKRGFLKENFTQKSRDHYPTMTSVKHCIDVGFTHVSLCSRASLSLGTLSLCESLLLSPSTVSSWGRESSKHVPVVEWMYRFMEGSAGTASQDEVPRLEQLRALGCWSIRQPVLGDGGRGGREGTGSGRTRVGMKRGARRRTRSPSRRLPFLGRQHSELSVY